MKKKLKPKDKANTIPGNIGPKDMFEKYLHIYLKIFEDMALIKEYETFDGSGIIRFCGRCIKTEAKDDDELSTYSSFLNKIVEICEKATEKHRESIALNESRAEKYRTALEKEYGLKVRKVEKTLKIEKNDKKHKETRKLTKSETKKNADEYSVWIENMNYMEAKNIFEKMPIQKDYRDHHAGIRIGTNTIPEHADMTRIIFGKHCIIYAASLFEKYVTSLQNPILL